jgi:hypothetical protein
MQPSLRNKLHHIGPNAEVLARVLNSQTLIHANPLTFGMSPIPAMLLWLGLNLCVQQGVGLQSQRQNMPVFIRYILSSLLRNFPGRMIHRMIPNYCFILKQVFSKLRRPEFILPRQRRMMRLPSPLSMCMIAPSHLRELRENVNNAMTLVCALNPRTLLPHKPFAISISPVPAMIQVLGLNLFVQQGVGQHNQKKNMPLFMRYMLSNLLQTNPVRMIQKMIPNYCLFMKQVFLETTRKNPLCKPGIPYPILPIFLGEIEPRHFRNFREMIRSCVSQNSYVHLELITHQDYTVLIELYCETGSIRYFSVTVRDQFGSLVEAIIDLEASQWTRDLFVPKLTPLSISLTCEIGDCNRFPTRRFFLEFGYTSSVTFTLNYVNLNLNVEGIKLSTKKL